MGCDTIIWYVVTSVAYAVSHPQENNSLYIRQREKHKIAPLPANKMFVLMCKLSTLCILVLRVSFLMNFGDCSRISGSKGTVFYEIHARAVRQVSSHFEYLESRSRGLVVTWQPVGGHLTVHP